MTTPTLRPLRCKTCRHLLGACAERVLVVGGAHLKTTTTLYCGQCGARRVWHPLPSAGQATKRAM